MFWCGRTVGPPRFGANPASPGPLGCAQKLHHPAPPGEAPLSIHVALNHVTQYRYDRRVSLSPQIVVASEAPNLSWRPIYGANSFGLQAVPKTIAPQLDLLLFQELGTKLLERRVDRDAGAPR